MVEINRIRKSVKNPKFLSLVFGEKENFEIQKKFSVQSIAARFCAKEAFSKAVGLGFRGFSFKDVEVLHDNLGKPYISLEGSAKKLMKNENYEISVSLTHTKSYASAVVVIEKNPI